MLLRRERSLWRRGMESESSTRVDVEIMVPGWMRIDDLGTATVSSTSFK
jgi:hypothetical protein